MCCAVQRKTLLKLMLFSGTDVSNSCLWCWCGGITKLIHNKTVPPSVEQEQEQERWSGGKKCVKRKISQNIHPTTLFRLDRWYEQNNLVLNQLSLSVSGSVSRWLQLEQQCYVGLCIVVAWLLEAVVASTCFKMETGTTASRWCDPQS